MVTEASNGVEPSPTVKDLIGFRVARPLVEGGWFTGTKVPRLANRLARLIEGRIRTAIEKGTGKPYRG